MTCTRNVRARSVEFGHQDSLPLAEDDLPTRDLQRQAVAQQQRPQVRVGVHPVAIRVLGVVVAPFLVAGDHQLEETLDVGQQRGLELVDEHSAGRVHRPQADDALADPQLADESHDALGEIHELESFVGIDDEGLAVNRQASRLGRCDCRHRRFANGHGRTLAHALLVDEVRRQGRQLVRRARAHKRDIIGKNDRVKQGEGAPIPACAAAAHTHAPCLMDAPDGPGDSGTPGPQPGRARRAGPRDLPGAQ